MRNFNDSADAELLDDERFQQQPEIDFEKNDSGDNIDLMPFNNIQFGVKTKKRRRRKK